MNISFLAYYFKFTLFEVYAIVMSLIIVMFLSEGKSPSQTHQECDMDFCRCST